jgi:hypothetical protein
MSFFVLTPPLLDARYDSDRPDNMAVFENIRIEAEKEAYPVLLSNGNFVEAGDVDGTNRHFSVWTGRFHYFLKKILYIYVWMSENPVMVVFVERCTHTS